MLIEVSLAAHITMFWNDVYKSYDDVNHDMHMKILTKVQFETGEYRSLSIIKPLNYEDMDHYIEFLIKRLSKFFETYTVTPLTKIIFTYMLSQGKGLNTIEGLIEKLHVNTTHGFNNLVLPVTLLTEEYGDILATQQFLNVTRHVVENVDNVYTIDVRNDSPKTVVQMRGPADLRWVDTKMSPSLFKREIEGGTTIYVNDKTPIVKEKIFPTKPFNKTQVEKNLIPTTKFMTIDIETMLYEGIHRPYLICGYTENKFIHSLSKVLQ